MATRFYFSAVPAEAGLTPAFSAWTRTTEGTRRMMRVNIDGSGITTTAFGGNVSRAADETILDRQFISAPMVAGILFDAAVTVKGQVKCLESAVNDNINRQPIVIKIVNRAGTIVQATPLALAHYGPATTEWNPPATGSSNRILADEDALTGSYTTVAGDRLVLEIGGQVSAAGGTSVTGQQVMQANSAGDLPEDELSTDALNPWFEFSNTITFESTPFAVQDVRLPARMLRDYGQHLAFVPVVAAAAPTVFLDWLVQQAIPQSRAILVGGEVAFVPIEAPVVPPAPELLTLPGVQLHSIVQRAPDSIVGY